MAEAVKMVKIDKEWGFEQIVVNSPLYCAKFLHFKPGKKSSLHYHNTKDETFYVMDGDCGIQTSLVEPNPWPVFYKGQSKHIPPGLPHRVHSKLGCLILEISTHHDDADVVRIEPSGNL
jgi:mannose-6-phosphate isomerase-like protein (cupin superfamily)